MEETSWWYVSAFTNLQCLAPWVVQPNYSNGWSQIYVIVRFSFGNVGFLLEMWPLLFHTLKEFAPSWSVWLFASLHVSFHRLLSPLILCPLNSFLFVLYSPVDNHRSHDMITIIWLWWYEELWYKMSFGYVA